MPYVRLKDDNEREKHERILEWVRVCRSALVLAEKTLVDVRFKVSIGVDPLPVLRAGSHHIKMARDAFNNAVNCTNDVCKHLFDDARGEFDQHYGHPANLEFLKEDIERAAKKERRKNEV